MTKTTDPTLKAVREESAANDALAQEQLAPGPRFADAADPAASPSQVRPAPPADPSFDAAYERQHGYPPPKR